MLDDAIAVYGDFILAAGVFLFVLTVVSWIILPFALIGTKPLLRELIAEVKRNNEILNARLGPDGPQNHSPDARDAAP